jgi:hypothetical protein
MLARSPVFHAAMAAQAFTPAYRSALQDAFGADWMQWHERVRDWSRHLDAPNTTQAAGVGDV